VSHVDEETDFFNAMSPQDMVIALAIAKAHTVRELIDYPAIIIGCDSTFECGWREHLANQEMQKLLQAELRKLVGDQDCFILDIALLTPKREKRSQIE
jgi:predicted house-cleaning NTP pyrophosphatase (Maf/HAM1 superfamily)